MTAGLDWGLVLLPVVPSTQLKLWTAPRGCVYEQCVYTPVHVFSVCTYGHGGQRWMLGIFFDFHCTH